MSNKIDSKRIAEIKVNVLRIMVIAVMGLTLIGAVFIPGVTDKVVEKAADPATGIVIALVTYIYLCLIPFLIALYAVKRLCDIISDGDSFSIRSLKQLSIIVWCCFAEIAINCTAALVFGLFFNFQIFILNLFLIALAGVISVFTTVLKELVKAAIRIREENELTI